MPPSGLDLSVGFRLCASYEPRHQDQAGNASTVSTREYKMLDEVAFCATNALLITGMVAFGEAAPPRATSMKADTASATDKSQPRPAPEWEAVFARADGWTGGDGLTTIPLPGDRVLWLFGDSWI